MKTKNKFTLILYYLSIIIISFYIAIYILDIVYPQYLGVGNFNSLLVFKISSNPVPHPPSFSHGWEYYFGTTYYGIAILPALLASLKFDFSVMFPALFLSLSGGFISGILMFHYSGLYKKIILYITSIYFEMPYIGIILLILYIVRPSFSGFVIAIFLVWFPFYIQRTHTIVEKEKSMHRYSSKTSLLGLIPYIIVDMGAISGLIIFITYLGFYYKNPFETDIGNIMYLSGNVTQFLLFGDWWIILFPLLFISLFIIFTAILAYELRSMMEDDQYDKQ